mgnify:CR=1 FL=1
MGRTAAIPPESAAPGTSVVQEAPRIPLARYRIWFEACQPVTLPERAGSTWRGILGHALRRAVCVTGQDRCRDCLLVHACAHAYIFETPPPPDTGKMRKYTAAPHPFVLNPPPGRTRLQAGESYTLGLTLIGRGNRHLPYIIHALSRGARDGVGRGRAPMALTHVEQETAPGTGQWTRIHEAEGPLEAIPPQPPQMPPPPGHRVTLHLDTPLRIKREGRALGAADLGFGDLFSNLLRRVSLLSHFHTDTPLETDFAGLTQAARQWPGMEAKLQWQDWERYSSRQGRHVPMSGLTGRISLAPEGLAPFWPYLWLAPFLHVGAGTSMGQGACRMDRAKIHPED